MILMSSFKSMWHMHDLAAQTVASWLKGQEIEGEPSADLTTWMVWEQASTFFLSRTGSLRALITRADAEGTTLTFATRFCTVNLQVTRRPFQSFAVSLAISSPIFLGERPRGPILGASEDAAPTSPPVALTYTSTTAEGSNLGGIAAAAATC